MKTPLEQCAEIRGLGAPLVFCADKQSLPGKTVLHFVRFETIALDNDTLEAAPINVKQLVPP
jgi:hypothetical protein